MPGRLGRTNKDKILSWINRRNNLHMSCKTSQIIDHFGMYIGVCEVMDILKELKEEGLVDSRPLHEEERWVS